jgi:hypothetical protein
MLVTPLRRVSRIAGLAGATLLGCSGPSCDVCTSSAVVYGLVRYAGGGPIAGAQVTVEGRQESCSSPTVVIQSDSGLVAGPDGAYRTRLISPFGMITACLRVTAVPPGATVEPVVAEGATVELNPDFGTNRQRDSTQVDLEVPLGSGYQADPVRLVGQFSGDAGQDGQHYNLLLQINGVTDSVRGLWSLSYTGTCATHDGPFSGTLTGDQLQLRLRPDEEYEVTIDLPLRVVPGDSVLTGDPTVVALGNPPIPPCGTEELAPLTLHSADTEPLSYLTPQVLQTASKVSQAASPALDSLSPAGAAWNSTR